MSRAQQSGPGAACGPAGAAKAEAGTEVHPCTLPISQQQQQQQQVGSIGQVDDSQVSEPSPGCEVEACPAGGEVASTPSETAAAAAAVASTSAFTWTPSVNKAAQQEILSAPATRPSEDSSQLQGPGQGQGQEWSHLRLHVAPPPSPASSVQGSVGFRCHGPTLHLGRLLPATLGGPACTLDPVTVTDPAACTLDHSHSHRPVFLHDDTRALTTVTNVVYMRMHDGYSHDSITHMYSPQIPGSHVAHAYVRQLSRAPASHDHMSHMTT